MKSIARDKYIKVYVFQVEKEDIENRAKVKRTTSSNYLRCCGLGEKLVNKPLDKNTTIRVNAGSLHSQLISLRHLVKPNQKLVSEVESAIALLEEIMVATIG